MSVFRYSPASHVPQPSWLPLALWLSSWTCLQSQQVFRPTGEYVSFVKSLPLVPVHGVHAALPIVGWYWPAVHVVHSSANAPEYLPLAQLVHSAVLSDAAVPGPQSLQAPISGSGATVPDLHASHALRREVEIVPARQTVHEASPSSFFFPTGHRSQRSRPAFGARPAGQSWHGVPSGEYFPVSHWLQASKELLGLLPAGQASHVVGDFHIVPGLTSPQLRQLSSPGVGATPVVDVHSSHCPGEPLLPAFPAGQGSHCAPEVAYGAPEVPELAPVQRPRGHSSHPCAALPRGPVRDPNFPDGHCTHTLSPAVSWKNPEAHSVHEVHPPCASSPGAQPGLALLLLESHSPTR